MLSWRTDAVRRGAEELGGQLGEPALDEVDPRAAGRGEVQDEPGVLREPALDGRGLVAGGVVEHEVHVEVGGHSWSIVLRNFRNSTARWRWCSEPMTSPDCDVQRGVQAGGAVALVVVGGALGRAGQHRQVGAVRSNA